MTTRTWTFPAAKREQGCGKVLGSKKFGCFLLSHRLFQNICCASWIAGSDAVDSPFYFPLDTKSPFTCRLYILLGCLSSTTGSGLYFRYNEYYSQFLYTGVHSTIITDIAVFLSASLYRRMGMYKKRNVISGGFSSTLQPPTDPCFFFR